MNFAVELLTYHKPEHKHFIGSKPGGMQLIEVGVAEFCRRGYMLCGRGNIMSIISSQKLIHDFLFPASRLVVESRMKKSEV